MTVAYNDYMMKKNGFTLVEILIVIALIGILGTVAVSNYMGSTKTFSFLAEYKELVSQMRQVRSYAVTNKSVKVTYPHNSSTATVTPERYGLLLDTKDIIFFADDGPIPFSFDLQNPQNPSQQTDGIIKTMDLRGTPYSLTIDGGPLYLYYERGSGKLTTYENTTLTDKAAISFRFANDADLVKYITIFQVSGLVEGFDSPPAQL